MDLERQRQLATSAKTYFDNELKPAIVDSRRRYNMDPKDKAERIKNDLSAIPSTKATAAVDRYVESSLILYHTDPDSIGYISRNVQDPNADALSKWLTEIFKYRAENSFPFFTWHHASLNAGGVDGLEAGLVWWRKESYSEKVEKFFTISNGQKLEVTEEQFKQGSILIPDAFFTEKVDVETVCTDTFWIDQLEPGVDVLWDPNIPLLNVNLGQFGLVKLPKSLDEVENLAKRGIIDSIDREELKTFIKKDKNTDSLGTSDSAKNPRSTDGNDLGDKNTVEFWMFFTKEGGRWFVQFSIEGKRALSEQKSVDEVFFGGRKVNTLPFCVGATKLKLWKSAGRSLPETIAPLDDQHYEHINNVNDAVKINIQGQYRVNPDSDLRTNDLLNRRIVYAEQGEFDRIEKDFGVLSTMRVDDMISMGINELIPSSMAMGGRGVVPKGTEKGLGLTQMGRIEGDEKQGVHIKTRNETFLKPILTLIAQNIFAFETNDEVLRKAAANAGINPPLVTTPDGRQVVNHQVLDFGVDAVVNAGLGAAPRSQKAQTLLQIVDVAKQLGQPQDGAAILRHLKTLAGFGADQFNVPPQQAPPPPPPQGKLTLAVTSTMAELMAADPTIGQYLLEELKRGHVDVTIKAKEPENPAMNLARQNGGGMMLPERAGMPIMDATGDMGAQMSAGGQSGAINR